MMNFWDVVLVFLGKASGVTTPRSVFLVAFCVNECVWCLYSIQEKGNFEAKTEMKKVLSCLVCWPQVGCHNTWFPNANVRRRWMKQVTQAFSPSVSSQIGHHVKIMSSSFDTILSLLRRERHLLHRHLSWQLFYIIGVSASYYPYAKNIAVSECRGNTTITQEHIGPKIFCEQLWFSWGLRHPVLILRGSRLKIKH